MTTVEFFPTLQIPSNVASIKTTHNSLDVVNNGDTLVIAPTTCTRINIGNASPSMETQFNGNVVSTKLIGCFLEVYNQDYKDGILAHSDGHTISADGNTSFNSTMADGGGIVVWSDGGTSPIGGFTDSKTITVVDNVPSEPHISQKFKIFYLGCFMDAMSGVISGQTVFAPTQSDLFNVTIGSHNPAVPSLTVNPADGTQVQTLRVNDGNGDPELIVGPSAVTPHEAGAEFYRPVYIGPSLTQDIPHSILLNVIPNDADNHGEVLVQFGAANLDQSAMVVRKGGFTIFGQRVQINGSDGDAVDPIFSIFSSSPTSALIQVRSAFDNLCQKMFETGFTRYYQGLAGMSFNQNDTDLLSGTLNRNYSATSPPLTTNSAIATLAMPSGSCIATQTDNNTVGDYMEIQIIADVSTNWLLGTYEICYQPVFSNSSSSRRYGTLNLEATWMPDGTPQIIDTVVCDYGSPRGSETIALGGVRSLRYVLDETVPSTNICRLRFLVGGGSAFNYVAIAGNISFKRIM